MNMAADGCPDARREPLRSATCDGACDHIGDAWAGSHGDYQSGEKKGGEGYLVAVKGNPSQLSLM